MEIAKNNRKDSSIMFSIVKKVMDELGWILLISWLKKSLSSSSTQLAFGILEGEEIVVIFNDDIFEEKTMVTKEMIHLSGGGRGKRILFFFQYRHHYNHHKIATMMTELLY